MQQRAQSLYSTQAILSSMKYNTCSKALLMLGLTLASAMTLQSCYKEDAQELYQRQYATSVAMADLQEQADHFNQKINGLELSVNMLINREPVSKIIYAVEKTDTVGAYLTLGKTTIYVPFGRDGKDGLNGKNGKDGVSPVFDVTIGDNGNWYINGQNTGKPARGPQGLAGANGTNGTNGTNGKDGCTPTFSAAQDKENTNDTRFYWTVTWCDGTTEFIKANGEKVVAKAQDGTNGKDGAQGPKGDKGDKGEKGNPGEPGVISPISKVALNKEGDKLTITTTYPNLPEVTIPIVPDLMFNIKPEESKEGDESRATVYAPLTNTLNFKPGQTLVFPYTKSKDLEKVFINSLPDGWKFSVNDKNITLTAPSLLKTMDSPNVNYLTFTARDKNGKAYQRDLVVNCQKAIYLNYFHNPSNGIATQPPSSPHNVLKLSNDNYKHDLLIYQLTPEGTYTQVPLSPEQTNVAGDKLAEQLRKDIAYMIDKSDELDFKNLLIKDFVYEKSRLQTAFLSSDQNEDSYVLRVSKFPTSVSQKAYYIEALPWNTYGAQTVIGNTSNANPQNKDRSLVTTIRLNRLVQRTLLYMKNPHKWLGIPAGEDIDVSQMKASIASALGVFANGTSWLFRTNQHAIVAKIQGAGITYDKDNDLLSVNFCHFPTQNSDSHKLLIEYTTKQGTNIRKIIAPGLFGSAGQVMQPMVLAGAGGVLIFRVGVPYTNNNTTYEHSVVSEPANSSGTMRPISPNLGGVRDFNSNFDDF